MSNQEIEEQETEPESYHEIVRLVKERDTELQALRTELDDLKQKCNTCGETKSKEKEQVIGFCKDCKHGLTNADIQGSVCPHCGKGTQYTNQP